jgi:hypothetical protein
MDLGCLIRNGPMEDNRLIVGGGSKRKKGPYGFEKKGR